MKYLLKNTETYRVDTLAEVEKLRNEVEESNWYSVDSFTYAYKENKKTGEDYYLVTAYNSIKDNYSLRYVRNRCCLYLP